MEDVRTPIDPLPGTGDEAPPTDPARAPVPLQAVSLLERRGVPDLSGGVATLDQGLRGPDAGQPTVGPESETWSWSRIRTWLRCPRRWWFEYGLNLPKQDTDLQEQGRSVHRALAAYYADGVREFDDIEDEETRSMIEGYIDWAESEGVDANMHVLAVETPLQGEVHGVPFRAVVDLILQDLETGAVYLLDHKTVSTFGAYPLHMDGQLLTYVWLARELGLGQAHYAGHNLLRRLKRRHTAKPPFYRRDVVSFSPTQLDRHATRLAALAERIQSDDLHPPVVDQSCAWGCPYLAVCPMVDDGVDVERLFAAARELCLTRTQASSMLVEVDAPQEGL